MLVAVVVGVVVLLVARVVVALVVLVHLPLLEVEPLTRAVAVVVSLGQPAHPGLEVLASSY
jgi:uncharacterized YccA/Bax inhibitor family protein